MKFDYRVTWSIGLNRRAWWVEEIGSGCIGNYDSEAAAVRAAATLRNEGFVAEVKSGDVPYPPEEAIEAVKRHLAARGIDGFTVTPGVGYWKGEREDCLTIVVLVGWDDFGSHAVADGIAHDLAVDLGQEAVAWAVDTLNGGGLAFS